MPRSPRRLRFAGAFLAIGLAVLPSEGLVLAVSDDATALPWCGSLSSEPVGPGPSASSWTSGHGDVYPGAWGGMASAPIAPRTEHSVVWTGDQAIYWGGDGAAYVPSDDTWREVAPSPLRGRARHTAIWTGSRMIVWGGGTGGRVLTDGAAYDPATDTWAVLADPGMGGRHRHQALWTGSRMLVYAGTDAQDESVAGGLAYDPVADTWDAIPADPLGDLDTRYVTWTGTRMLLVGYVDGRGAGTEVARMADFDPVSRRWRTLVGVPLSRHEQPRPVATGGATLVMSSQPPALHEGRPTSVILDARSSCWTTPRSVPPPNDGTLMPVWSGSLLLVLGQEGVAYDPTGDRWWSLPPAPPGAASRDAVPAVWAGDRVLVWSGLSGESSEPLADGVAFLPA